jgi:cytochrome c
MRRQAIILLGGDFTTFSAEPPATWFDSEVLAVIARIAAGPDHEALVTLASAVPIGLRLHIERNLTATIVIDRTPMEVPERFIPGREFYMKACIECHQAAGSGVPHTFPPLAGSEWVNADRDTLLRIILG